MLLIRFYQQLSGKTYTLGSVTGCDICIPLPDIAPLQLRMLVSPAVLELIDVSGKGFYLNSQLHSFAELPFVPGAVYSLQLGQQKLFVVAGPTGWQLRVPKPVYRLAFVISAAVLLGSGIAWAAWYALSTGGTEPQHLRAVESTMARPPEFNRAAKPNDEPLAWPFAELPAQSPTDHARQNLEQSPDQSSTGTAVSVQNAITVAEDSPSPAISTTATQPGLDANQRLLADAVPLAEEQAATLNKSAAKSSYQPPTDAVWQTMPDYSGLTALQPEGRRYFVFKAFNKDVVYRPKQRVYTLVLPNEGQLLLDISQYRVPPEPLIFRILAARKMNNSIEFRQATLQALILRIRYNRINGQWLENNYLLQQLALHWAPTWERNRDFKQIRPVLWELYNEAWYVHGRGELEQRDFLLNLAAAHDPAARLYGITMDVINKKLFEMTPKDWLDYMHSKELAKQIQQIAKDYDIGRILWLQQGELNMHLYFLASFWHQPVLENTPYRRLIGGEWHDNPVPVTGDYSDQLSRYLASLTAIMAMNSRSDWETLVMSKPDPYFEHMLRQAVWHDRVPGAYTLYEPIFRREYMKAGMDPGKFTDFALRYSQVFPRGVGLYQVLAEPIAAAQAKQTYRFRLKFFTGDGVKSRIAPFQECQSDVYTQARLATLADLEGRWAFNGLAQGHLAWDHDLPPGSYRIANPVNTRSHYQGRYFLDVHISTLPVSTISAFKTLPDNYGYTAYVYQQDIADTLPALCVTADFTFTAAQ